VQVCLDKGFSMSFHTAMECGPLISAYHPSNKLTVGPRSVLVADVDISIGAKMRSYLEDSFKSLGDLPLEHLPDTCETVSEHIESATEAFLFEELLRLRGYRGKKPPLLSRDYVFIRAVDCHIFSVPSRALGGARLFALRSFARSPNGANLNLSIHRYRCRELPHSNGS
jgi:hypothetical protein